MGSEEGGGHKIVRNNVIMACLGMELVRLEDYGVPKMLRILTLSHDLHALPIPMNN